MGDCLSYYLDTPAAGLWMMLDPVPEGHPDQGLERDEKVDKTYIEKGDPALKRKHPEDEVKDTNDKQLRKCIICNKRHEPRCSIPPGWRKEQKAKQREAKAKSKENAKGQKEEA